MCIFSQPKTPAPVAIPEVPKATATEVKQPAAAPQEQDVQVQQSRTEERQKRLRAAQSNSTLVTGGGGLVDQPATGLKTAFGA